MKHAITLAVALLATATFSLGPSAQAAAGHAIHVKAAAKCAPAQPKAAPASTGAASCCAGGNCCQGGACCAPGTGACTSDCGCPKAGCCG